MLSRYCSYSLLMLMFILFAQCGLAEEDVDGGLFLPDEDIAGILSYIPQNFGNQASPISPEEVAEVRQELFMK